MPAAAPPLEEPTVSHGPFLATPDIPQPRRLIEGHIFFHAVNMAGTASLCDFLSDGLQANNDSRVYLSPYNGFPPDRSLAEMSQYHREKRFVIAQHGLFGGQRRYPGTRVITLLRDPVRRIISAYYYLTKFHPEFIAGKELLDWVGSLGQYHYQFRQFAFDNLSADEQKDLGRLSQREIFARALARFEEDVDWFGIVELFDASVFTLAYEMGLEQVPLWRSIASGNDRPDYSAIGPEIMGQIAEIIGLEIAFYEAGLRRFRQYFSRFGGFPDLPAYIAARRGEP